jgi:hypothetical protein
VRALAASLIGACLATGSALAQAAPDEIDIQIPARTEWRWRFEVSPKMPVDLTRVEPDHVMPALATQADSRLWIGGQRTQLGLALHARGLDQGLLLRTQLQGDTSLALRLRGGRVGLVLAIPLNGRE